MRNVCIQHSLGRGQASTPNGIRTRVATLKGWCPRPLDDGGGRGEATVRLMRRMAGFALAAAGGYLAGTIPSADIASRLATGGSTDLRASGSGNPGAANAIKVLGARWGYGVMAADIV